MTPRRDRNHETHTHTDRAARGAPEAFVLALLSASAVPAAQRATGVTSAVTGTAADGSWFGGEFALSRFERRGGELYAVGTLAVTLTTTAGETLDVSSAVSLPVKEVISAQ